MSRKQKTEHRRAWRAEKKLNDSIASAMALEIQKEIDSNMISEMLRVLKAQSLRKIISKGEFDELASSALGDYL